MTARSALASLGSGDEASILTRTQGIKETEMTLFMQNRIFRALAATVAGGTLLGLAPPQPASAVLPTIPIITIPLGTIVLPPLVPIAVQDISVAITDNVSAIDQGSAIVTVITITNKWNVAAAGINVLYSPPLTHTGSIWACTVNPGDSCGGSTSGTGAISRSINLGAGKSAVFTVSAAVVPTATGTINSTVTIVPPVSFGDNNSASNQAADTTAINPSATTTTVAATTTTGAVTTTIAATTTTVAVAASPTVATTAAPPPTAAPAAADAFQIPTGAVKCQLVSNLKPGSQSVRCTAPGSTAKLPKRPATCDFDWEDIAVSATGKSFTVCAGDSIEGNFPVLAYGARWKRGVFTCTSAKSGVTCRNPSRRGFRISKTKRTYL